MLFDDGDWFNPEVREKEETAMMVSRRLETRQPHMSV